MGSWPNLLNSLSTKELFQQKVSNKLGSLIRHLKKKLNLDWELWVDVTTALIKSMLICVASSRFADIHDSMESRRS